MASKIKRAFGLLKGDIVRLVIDEDAFGLAERQPFSLNSNPEGCNQHTGPGCSSEGESNLAHLESKVKDSYEKLYGKDRPKMKAKEKKELEKQYKTDLTEMMKQRVEKTKQIREKTIAEREANRPQPLSHQEVANEVNRVSDSWGYKGHISIVGNEGPEFERGGVKWREGGNCNLVDGKIVIHAKSVGTVEDVKRLAAHEIMHGAYQEVYRQYSKEKSDFIRESKSHVLTDDVKEKNPTWTRLRKFRDEISEDQWEKDDGVTEYSKAYWKDYSEGKASFHIAMHETMAEIAGQHQLTGQIVGSPLFQEYYKKVRDEYKVITGQQKNQVDNILTTNTSLFREHNQYLDENHNPTTPEEATYLRWWKSDGTNGWATRAEETSQGEAVVNANPEGCNQHTGPGCSGGSEGRVMSHKEARSKGYIFHGMGSESFRELLGSKGFEGGGFSGSPVKNYGPKFIAIKKQDMPSPVFSQGMDDHNVQYTFRENNGPHKMAPVRSEHDVKYYGGQLYALPIKYIYEADEHGNLIRPLTDLVSTVNAGQFTFHTSTQKVKLFQQWLKTQIAVRLRNKSQDELWKKYINEGFKRGAGRSFDDVKQSELRRRKPELFTPEAQGQLRDFYAGSKDEFLRSSFAQPVAKEKLELLTSRTFDELEGMEGDMVTKLTRTLADGLVEGKGPREVARDLGDELDIPKARALTISRTELIRAHAEGQLTALEGLGVEELGVAIEWSTSGMGTTALGNPSPCPKCAPMEGVVLTVSEARGKIPFHPN
jgi:hypothetical protein